MARYFMFTLDMVMSTKLQTATQTKAVATNVTNSFVLNVNIYLLLLARQRLKKMRPRLFVFDFDNTIYTHSREGLPNSCSLLSPPENYKLSDNEFLHELLTDLIQQKHHVGVASFGKKQIIIETMNKILGFNNSNSSSKYANNVCENRSGYFNDQNVMTAQDVPEFWAIKLQKYSKTFQTYMQNANNDILNAFESFKAIEKPETNPKMYFCMDLGPQAKVQMIKQLCQHYGITQLSDVLFFDDNTANIEEALTHGIQAFAVPPFSGITKEWFIQQTFHPYCPDKPQIKSNLD